MGNKNIFDWGPESPTNADIYHRLGNIEGKLTAFLSQGIPKRVSSLERSRSWVMGGVAAIVAGIAFIFKGTT